MKNQQRLIVGLILAILLVVFALLNGQAVEINFFGMSVHWPLIIVLLGALLLGAVATLLVTTTQNAKVKKEMNALQKENADLTGNLEKRIQAATEKATKQAAEEITDLKAQLAAAKADNKAADAEEAVKALDEEDEKNDTDEQNEN